MVHVTPANEHYRYTNQDCDERQAILSDLGKNLRDYLAHADGLVRCYADHCSENYGMRRIRNAPISEQWAREYLFKLHKRLRELAS